MADHSTFRLLRFHFSLFLMPVFLLALAMLPAVDWYSALLVFLILHFLVYPSSNGYNSYMDRDTTPIGGLEHPPMPTRRLFVVTIWMDVIAVTLGLLVSVYFAAGVLLYIAASRAYSYRGIRLKRFPVVGYVVVVVCQGALVFFLSYHGMSVNKTLNVPLLPMGAASCLIGGYYPLTQVYQHEADRADGIVTISMLLGKMGTFVFCGGVFALATVLMFLTFEDSEPSFFPVFLGCMLPVLVFFSIWALRVRKNEAQANFRNSLRMNVLAATCTSVCFIILIVMQHF